MNQRFDPNDKRPINPTAWPADEAARPGPTAGVDPLTDPLATRPVDPSAPPVQSKRSNWPVLIILLAGLVLALLVWLPAEMSNTGSDTATQPAPAAETTTPPADATAPAPATPPAAESTTPPATNTAPATPPAAENTTPPAASPAPAAPPAN